MGNLITYSESSLFSLAAWLLNYGGKSEHCAEKLSWKLVIFHFFQVLIVVYGSVKVYFSLKWSNSCHYSKSLTYWVEKVKIWKFGGGWAEFGLKKSIFTKKLWFFAVFSIFKQAKKPIDWVDFKILRQIILL